MIFCGCLGVSGAREVTGFTVACEVSRSTSVVVGGVDVNDSVTDGGGGGEGGGGGVIKR